MVIIGGVHMTLDRAKPGQRLLITQIEDPQIRAQAIRFGISEGSEAICQLIIPAGPVVLRRNRQEIAIGRKLASAISVKVITK